jgi:hypothetical protein
MYIRRGAEEGFTLHSCRSEMLMVKRVMKGESCWRDPDDQSALQHPAANKLFPECVPTLADLHQTIKPWVCRAQHFNAQNYSARVVTGNRFS